MVLPPRSSYRGGKVMVQNQTLFGTTRHLLSKKVLFAVFKRSSSYASVLLWHTTICLFC
jgi:hypothetical protein